MADIRLIKPDTDLSKYRPLPWDVVIHNRPYYVIDIPGYVHTIGGQYGENSYWAYPRDEKPTYENLIEFDCSYPVCWGIRYEPHNYTKCKWDECRASSAISCVITRNGEDFCKVHGGLAKAQWLIDEINEHPLGFNEIDFDKKMIGRKVWWRSEPGVITQWISGQGCVIIEPDGIERFRTPAEFVGDDFMDNEGPDIKTSIFDKHIWWFRE